jgi:hypothetical protein
MFIFLCWNNVTHFPPVDNCLFVGGYACGLFFLSNYQEVLTGKCPVREKCDISLPYRVLLFLGLLQRRNASPMLCEWNERGACDCRPRKRNQLIQSHTVFYSAVELRIRLLTSQYCVWLWRRTVDRLVLFMSNERAVS